MPSDRPRGRGVIAGDHNDPNAGGAAFARWPRARLAATDRQDRQGRELEPKATGRSRPLTPRAAEPLAIARTRRPSPAISSTVSRSSKRSFRRQMTEFGNGFWRALSRRPRIRRAQPRPTHWLPRADRGGARIPTEAWTLHADVARHRDAPCPARGKPSPSGRTHPVRSPRCRARTGSGTDLVARLLAAGRHTSPPARSSTIVIRFCVKVPVLSVQRTVAEPSVSMAATRRVKTRAREIRHAPITMKTVRTSGNSSGSIDIASAMPPRNASSQPPRQRP